MLSTSIYACYYDNCIIKIMMMMHIGGTYIHQRVMAVVSTQPKWNML